MMANVIRLENEVTEVYSHIEKYLRSLTSGTRAAYTTGITQFFKLNRRKEINELNNLDVQVTLKDFDEFIFFLLEHEENSPATANKKISGVKKLIGYLYERDVVGVQSDKAVRATKQLKTTSEGYDSLTHDEVLKMAELATTKKNGRTKELLIKLAFDTCLRKSELLMLTWNHFIDIEGEDEIKFKDIGKGGKKFKKSISREFYNELLELKTGESEMVFNITKNHFQESMKELIEELNIHSSRRIVFHSIRKAGAKYHYIQSGNDIRYVQAILGHSDPKTTAIYLEIDDYGALGAISTKGKVDLNAINEVSHEDLLKAIEGMDSSFKVLLANKIRQNNNK